VARARHRRRHPALDQLDRRRARATRAPRRAVAHFERHADVLDDDAKRRLHANPLRLLDSKSEAMQPMIAKAPRLVDALGGESRAHFDALAALLSDAGIAFEVEARLVRGLDYYNRTVFEWITDRSARRAPSPAAGVTTGCSRRSAASRRPRAASRSASSG
jgi:histidyl-tRNA synthetase